MLQHAKSENLGTIEDALRAADVTFEYVRAFHGQLVPDRVDGSADEEPQRDGRSRW